MSERSYRLPRERRLKKAAEFSRVYGEKQRAGDEHLLIFAAANAGETRFGVSVAKRHHGNAVKRVRIKRLLREAFRLEQHELPSRLDLILIPRKDSGAGIDEYRESLLRLARRLARRLLPGEPAPSG